MAPKHHPTPLSGSDRKALTKELGKARAMTGILAAQSAEMRTKGVALIQQADTCLTAASRALGMSTHRSTSRPNRFRSRSPRSPASRMTW
jgi:hypothetical protein